MLKNIITDVFFDLDHTLWDFEKNSELTFQKIFSDAHINMDIHRFIEVYKPINLEFWKLYRENKISQEDLRLQRLQLTFDALGYHLDLDILRYLVEQYIEHLCTFKHLLPHAKETLTYLKPNYKLHIITNGFEAVQYKKLQNSGIISFFDQVIHSEMAGVKKPNPKIFELALEKSKVPPKNAIMIGDSLEADILGAQAVGLHTIHINVHKEPNHGYCTTINDLIEIKNHL